MSRSTAAERVRRLRHGTDPDHHGLEKRNLESCQAFESIQPDIGNCDPPPKQGLHPILQANRQRGLMEAI